MKSCSKNIFYSRKHPNSASRIITKVDGMLNKSIHNLAYNNIEQVVNEIVNYQVRILVMNKIISIYEISLL
jgi:hypothetical protein